MRRLACAIVLILALAIPAGAQPPVPPGLAELRQAVDGEIRGLAAAATAAEVAWRASFVGEMRHADGSPRDADEILLPVRKAAEAADELRRTVADLDARRARRELDVSAFTDQLIEQAVAAVLERWGLHLDETENTVELARRRYVDAVAGGRATAQQEAQARAQATTTHRRATAALRTARDRIVADLGGWLARARQLGRAAAADSIAQRVDAHLDATPRGAAGATRLDGFLKAQSVPFEAAPAGTAALTMEGELAAIDIARLGTPRPQPQLRFVKAGPGGWEPAGALAFGPAAYVEVGGDADAGPDERVVELTWSGGRETVTARRAGQGVWRSDPLIVWPPPGGRAPAARPAPATPPARAPAPTTLSSLLDTPPAPIDGDASGAQAAPTGLDAAIASLRAAITARRVFRPEMALDSPGKIRRKAVEYRDHVDRIRAKLFVAELPAESAQALATFRTKWEDLAEAVWTGQRPVASLPGARWTALASGFDLPACRSLPAPAGRDIRLAGRHWACLSDAFLRELIERDAAVDHATERKRVELTSRLEQLMRDVERGLEPANRPRPDEQERRRWLLDMSRRLHAVWLEASEKKLEAMDGKRTLANRNDSAYRWFQSWARRVEAVAPPPAGALRLSLPPGTTVSATVEGVTQQVRVEAAAPSDPGGFFARALYDVLHEARYLAPGAAAALAAQLRAYDAELEERFASPNDPHLQAPAAAALRQQAVAERRSRLEASRSARLDEIGARLVNARARALAAIEALR
jgi:hypothetical protein